MITKLNSSARRSFGMLSRGWPLWTVLLLGFGLRLFRLGAQSIWYDEGVSLYLAGQSLPDLIRHTAADIHPPLYYVLLHFWVWVVGNSEFAAAFLSLAFGLFLIALAYRISAHLYNRRVALIAAALIALSPFNLWYSQEIRMYTLGAFLGLVAFWSASRCLTDRVEPERRLDGRACWILYVVATAAGLYALYYSAFLVIALNVWAVWWVVRKGRLGSPIRATLTRWTAAQVAVVVLYLPWLPVAVRQALNPPVPPWRSPVSLWSIVVQSWGALLFGQSVTPDQVWWALLLAAALFGIGIWAIQRHWGSRGLAVVLYGLGPVGLIVLFSVWTPLFHVRYVFTYSPAFYLVMAVGLAWVMRRAPVLGSLSVVIWLIVSGYSVYQLHTSPLYAADDFRSAVRDLGDRIGPGDALLINAGYAYPPFLYYSSEGIAWRGRLVDYRPPSGVPSQGLVVLQSGSIGGNVNLGWGRPDADFYATDETQTAEALARVFAAHSRLWVLRAYDTVVDPDGFVRTWLDRHGRQFQDQLYAGESYIRVQGYLTQREPRFDTPALGHSVQATFGGRLQLLGWTSVDDSARAGQAWSLDLYWQALDVMAGDYHAVVELLDVAGRPWARDDRLLLGNAYPTSRWLKDETLSQPVKFRIPAGVPAGLYMLRVMIYDPKKQEALSAVDGTGQLASGAIDLGQISVVD